MAPTGRPFYTALVSPQLTRSTLVEIKYLPSFPIRVLPTSANFESKLVVRALLWSANNGTPRSSCICLLFTYHREPVARRRYVDCNTSIFRIWERASVLHGGHPKFIMGRKSCLYITTPFLTDRYLFLLRRVFRIPNVWAA
jgi:hypothetical protein